MPTLPFGDEFRAEPHDTNVASLRTQRLSVAKWLGHLRHHRKCFSCKIETARRRLATESATTMCTWGHGFRRPVTGFRTRVREQRADTNPLIAYADGALALGESSDVVAARCWVGLFAEAIR